VITFDNVTKLYKTSTRPALNEISLTIDKGDFVFLIGPSGSGKSTFLELMIRETNVTYGDIHIDDFHVNKLKGRQINKLRQKIGYVFQDFRLLQQKTVYDNVAFALEVIGTRKDKIARIVPNTLELVDLAGKENRYPHELSGGEQQRVAIARAFVNRPLVLLADEPTGNLIREALRGLGRNLTMTMALIITTAISLALLATGFLVTTMTERTKDIYLDRVEVMVQFNDDVSAKDKDCTSKECTEVRDLLSKSDGVASVTFRSREQSYQRYVELFQESDPLLVKETSPDALPAALHVRLTNPLDTTPLNPIRQLPQVATIIDQVDDLSDATSNLDAIRNATFLFAAVQALAAIFLIVNMVQITAFNRRQETEIMRMVGASRWYTQAPFVLEAIIAVLAGSILSALALFAGKIWVVDKILKVLYDSQLVARVTNADIWLITPIVALIGIAFAAITAQGTLRWYVRK